MDEKIDHGPIIEQFEEVILETDTFETLAKRLFEKSAESLTDIVKRSPEDQTAKAQDDSKATYTKTLTREDGYIDQESINPLKIENLKLKIRAFHPWPGVWTYYKLRATRQTLIKLLPGEKIQVEGKSPMSYKDFINGYANGEKFLRAINLISN